MDQELKVYIALVQFPAPGWVVPQPPITLVLEQSDSPGIPGTVVICTDPPHKQN